MRKQAWLAVLPWLCGYSWAQELYVNLDPAKTTINWILEGNVHTVHGTFRLKNGHITLNTAGGIIGGELVVDAVSGESGNGSRDKRMHKEILESGKYPEIRLIPSKLEGTVAPGGASDVRVSGTFEIHGGTHQLTIPMHVSISGSTITGTGKFSVPYVDWGMKDPSNFLFKVDKSVEVDVTAVGTSGGK